MLEQRFEHHSNVPGKCPTCGQSTHLAKRKADGRWFWVHDAILPAKSLATHRMSGHDAEIAPDVAETLAGGVA